MVHPQLRLDLLTAIRATLKHGVLELHLPKAGNRRPRTIQVAAA